MLIGISHRSGMQTVISIFNTAHHVIRESIIACACACVCSLWESTADQIQIPSKFGNNPPFFAHSKMDLELGFNYKLKVES
jgi:hypothetical protein